MNIKKYLFDILNLPDPGLEEYQVAKGIGYELSFIPSIEALKIRLSGQIDYKLLKHLVRQILSFQKTNQPRSVLLDLNYSYELKGSPIPLRNLARETSLPQLIVVLLPDWSEKKNHIRFLNLMGYQTIRFFFSFAGAINWLSAQNRNDA